jgi:crotonobetainyl-CoA:carnitine CoA-transferase CaiB-like acyl-CoA transferase
VAGALHGYSVLDLTQHAAGALTSMLLAEHGASVLRVLAPLTPDFRDGPFVVFDRGKRSCRLDVREALTALDATTTAQVTFDRLLLGADVVIEDWSPSDSIREMLDSGVFSAVNPSLVHLTITAYGREGPWKDEPPIDDLVLARTGVLAGLPGYRDPPVHLVHPLPSVGAGALGALGVAAALLARRTDGIGRRLDTSLMAGALLYHPKVTGEDLAPHVFQRNPAGSAPFYSVYQCADGEWLQLGCVHEGFVNTAASLLGITDWLAAPRFGKGLEPATSGADSELRERLAELIGTRSQSEWMVDFEAADVPFAPARWSQDALADPQVLHNQMVTTLDDPVLGPVAQMGVGLSLSETPGAIPGPRGAPQSTESVLADWPKTRSAAASAPMAGSNDTSTADSSGGSVATGAATTAPPLAGRTILEISNLIAGPTAGRLLADLGADVIKLEPPAGDMSRPIGRTYFYSVNFNKRSVCANLTQPEGKAVVQAIARNADALVANLRPGATQRMGINRELNPALIETHLTGYGTTGPYSKRPGIDPLAQALMGLSRAQGGRFNGPVFPAQLAPTDFTTGAIGAFGTVLAMLARDAGHPPQNVESNLLNAAILISSEWFLSRRNAPTRPLADREQYGLDPFHRLYRTRDGWIYVAADGPAQRKAFPGVLDIADDRESSQLPGDDEHANHSSFARSVAEAIAGRGNVELLEALRRADVPAAPAESGDSEVFLGAEHALRNGVVSQVPHPRVGLMRVAWRYVQFEGVENLESRPTPLLGEHSREVLEQCGYDPDTIDSLFAAGTVLTATDM